MTSPSSAAPHRNRRDQQSTEVRHVAAFLELASLEAEYIPGDRPDCVLVIGGRRIGVEHRELTEEDLASTARNIDRFEEALDTELRRIGADADLLVAVSVDAAAPFFRRRRDVEELSQRLAAFAAERARSVAPDDSVTVGVAELAAHRIAGPSLVSVSRDAARDTGPFGIVARGYWGPGAAAVEAAIREKEQLLPGYAQGDPSLAEFWLLLVTGERWEQATDSALTEWVRVATPFDRVYLMDLRAGVLQRVDAGGA